MQFLVFLDGEVIFMMPSASNDDLKVVQQEFGLKLQAGPEQTIALPLDELSLPDLQQDSQAVAKSVVEVFADPLAEDIGAWSMRLGEVAEVFRFTDHGYGKPEAPATSATGSTPRPRPAWPRARPAGRSRTTCS